VDRLHHDAIARPEAAARGRLDDLREGLVPDDAALRDAVVEVPLEDVQAVPQMPARSTRSSAWSWARVGRVAGAVRKVREPS